MKLRKVKEFFGRTRKAASDMVVTLMLTVIVIALCLAFNTWMHGATDKVYTKANTDIDTILNTSQTNPNP